MFREDKEKKIIDAEESLNELISDLLLNLYMSKSVDEKTVNKFFTILKQLKNLFEEENYVPKRLTATLLKTYFIMDGETMNATPEQQVMLLRLLSETQGLIRNIYEQGTTK